MTLELVLAIAMGFSLVCGALIGYVAGYKAGDRRWR